MRWSRERREFQARQEAGHNWAEEASREKIHVNLLSLYKKIILRQLVPENIRATLSTFDVQSRPAVKACQRWFVDEIARTHFAETMRSVAHDALHGFGIIKTGLATPSIAAMKSWNVSAGEVYSSRVDFDDWVWDVHARHWSECSFMGHRFRVPLQTIKDSKRYNKARKDLTASDDRRYNTEGDLRIDVLSRGFYGNDEEFEDMVDLWEFYLPRHGLIVTVPEDSLSGITSPSRDGTPLPLLEQNYIGPDDGPYTFLVFEDIIGNLLPKGPMMDLLEPHLNLNNIMRKLIRQAERMKENTVLRKGDEGDAKRYEDAIDGQILFANNPKETTIIKQGGPDQNLFQFFIQFKQIYSWLAGNLDVEGGLAPQGRTATQEKILNQNSGSGVQDMQERVTGFTKKVLANQLWYHWKHPQSEMETTYAPKGLSDMQIPQKVSPWNSQDPQAMKRTGNFEDITIDVSPMISLTPQQRGQQLRSLIMQLWAPLQQQASAQGVVLNFPMLFEKLGHYDDDPDYAEIFNLTEPGGIDEGDDGGSPAPETTTHIRENVSQRTMQGNDAMQSNALRGIDGGGNGSQNGQLVQQ